MVSFATFLISLPCIVVCVSPSQCLLKFGRACSNTRCSGEYGIFERMEVLMTKVQREQAAIQVVAALCLSSMLEIMVDQSSSWSSVKMIVFVNVAVDQAWSSVSLCSHLTVLFIKS